MKKPKKVFHISVDEDAMQNLLWAKARAIDEYRKGLLIEPVKSYADAIVWMHKKMQELSKVLKGRLDNTDPKKDDDDDETIKKSE